MKATYVTVDYAKELVNDERKFNQFLTKNKSFLYKIVQSQYKKNTINKNDSEVIEDLMQEASLSLWNKALRKYTGETKFTTFAFTVIKNDLLRYLQDKTKFENKTGFQLRSIEEYKNPNNHENNGADYLEKLFIVDPSKREFEANLIDHIDNQNKKSKLSALDLKIISLRDQGKTVKEMAKEVNLNVHTFKAYFYGSFKKKVSA
jgi:RNA polymerase sigma factor (sigma-70 family)